MNHVNKALNYRIRAAQLADIPAILALFSDEVKAGRMLPRKKENMQADIQDWRVASLNDDIVGCVSLVFFNPTLCEVRSLAVAKPYRQNGLGKKMIAAALDLAQARGVPNVLTLTRSPWIFEHFGFHKDDIHNFPEKVHQDCRPCPFINCCDEVALLCKLEERKGA